MTQVLIMECVSRVAADEAHELHGHPPQHTQHVAKQAALREVPLRHPQRKQDLLFKLVRTHLCVWFFLGWVCAVLSNAEVAESDIETNDMI